ncbi:ATP synthase subunit 9 [Striga asiatica]|uniref:ATP synthase subunit 9 n=1 Tax=Striga asiatica TaxID=4170 RepID=A0A5A7PZR3_STRAF|nr:ATP synthase subunit 9 [Striga asiatica]
MLEGAKLIGAGAATIALAGAAVGIGNADDLETFAYQSEEQNSYLVMPSWDLLLPKQLPYPKERAVTRHQDWQQVRKGKEGRPTGGNVKYGKLTAGRTIRDFDVVPAAVALLPPFGKHNWAEEPVYDPDFHERRQLEKLQQTYYPIDPAVEGKSLDCSGRILIPKIQRLERRLLMRQGRNWLLDWN